MKLYIGNLPFDIRDEELRSMFASYSSLGSVTVIVDNTSGRSRGFGFVEIADPAEGQAAIASLNGTEHGGRSLTVNEARPQGGGSSDRRGPRGQGGRGGNDRERRGFGGSRW